MNTNKISFFIKKNKKWNKIEKLIKKHQTIYIFGHNNPDGDCLGAQSALKQAIKLNYPLKNVYAPVRNSLKKWVFPTYPDDPVPDSKALQKNLMIIVDVAQTKRTDYHELAKASHLLIIDHHIMFNQDQLSDLPHWIDHQYGSVCEMLTIFFIFQRWRINQNISNALLTGIITDTGNLKFNSTQARTFYICGYLIKKHAQLTRIHEKINELSKKDLAVFEYFQKNYTDAGKFKYLIFGPQDHKKLPWVNETHQLKRYMHFLKNIYETKICATLIQFSSEELIHCSLRSKKIDVNQIATQFGGGGHKLASGVKLKSWKAAEDLINTVKKVVQEDQ